MFFIQCKPNLLCLRKRLLMMLSTFLAHCFPENFMTGYRIIFDREKMALGWKESDCKFIFPVLLHSYPSVFLFIFYMYLHILRL